MTGAVHRPRTAPMIMRLRHRHLCSRDRLRSKPARLGDHFRAEIARLQDERLHLSSQIKLLA
eukprot:scaffold10003_cov117-Isochrysis_galbana.AAC.5